MYWDGDRLSISARRPFPGSPWTHAEPLMQPTLLTNDRVSSLGLNSKNFQEVPLPTKKCIMPNLSLDPSLLYPPPLFLWQPPAPGCCRALTPEGCFYLYNIGYRATYTHSRTSSRTPELPWVLEAKRTWTCPDVPETVNPLKLAPPASVSLSLSFSLNLLTKAHAWQRKHSACSRPSAFRDRYRYAHVEKFSEQRSGHPRMWVPAHESSFLAVGL